MHGDAGVHRNGVDGADESVVWREVVDAVRHAAETEVVTLECGEAHGVAAGLEEELGRLDETGADAAEPMGGEIAAAQRSGDENHAAYFRAGLENQGFDKDVAGVAIEGGFLNGATEDFFPEFLAGVGDEESADAPAHAVPHNDHGLVERIFFLNGIELPAQDGGGVGVGVAARVAVKPELKMAADGFIGAEAVDERRPCRGGVHEAVNDEDDGFVGVVGLEAGNPRGLGEFRGLEHSGEFEFFRLRLLEHDGERNGEICCERETAAVEGDGFGGEGVFEGEFGGLTTEAEDGGDAVKNMWQREILAGAGVFFSADGDQWCADAGFGRTLGDILAMDIELVGGHEFVERGIPARAGVFFRGEDKITNIQRIRPRGELGLLEGFHNAGHGEVVGFARGLVFGIGFELRGGVLRLDEQSAETFGGLAFTGVEGGFESLRQGASADGCRKNRAALGNARVLGTPRGQKTGERQKAQDAGGNLA